MHNHRVHLTSGAVFLLLFLRVYEAFLRCLKIGEVNSAVGEPCLLGAPFQIKVEISKMKEIERDEEREHRIEDEAIVDAYGVEEQALGWYYYLDDKITFPFSASCIEARRNSPLKKGEKVSVIEMAPEDDCMHEMFVVIEWQSRNFGVPLAQLMPLDVDESTQEAIADWHYWVKRGYQLA